MKVPAAERVRVAVLNLPARAAALLTRSRAFISFIVPASSRSLEDEGNPTRHRPPEEKRKNQMRKASENF